MLPLPHRASTPLEILCPPKTVPTFLPTHVVEDTESGQLPTSPNKGRLREARPQSHTGSPLSNTKPARQSKDLPSRRPGPSLHSGQTPSRDLSLCRHTKSLPRRKAF